MVIQLECVMLKLPSQEGSEGRAKGYLASSSESLSHAKHVLLRDKALYELLREGDLQNTRHGGGASVSV